MLDRREFVVGCAAALCSLGCPPGGGGNGGSLEVDRAGFTALMNEPFQVERPDGSVLYADLVALEDGPVAPGLDQFVLRFRADIGDSVEAGLYEFYHTQMGEFLARIDPSDMDASSVFYACLFNQML